MKVVYVSRLFSSPEGGNIKTYIFHVTRCMVMSGHEVYLITEAPPHTWDVSLSEGVIVVPIEPAYPNRNYFSELQEYSERVYRTLKSLSLRIRLDVVEFAEYGAEGFITIRAKKLLNDFSQTKLVVKLHGPASLLYETDEEGHSNFGKSIQIFAEDYCIKNADVVTSSCHALEHYIKERLGIQPILKSPYPLTFPQKAEPRFFTNQQISKVIFVGSLHPRKGVDLFIRAAQLVLEKEPEFTFEIYGYDTPSDPFGNSYQAYLLKLFANELQQNVCFRGPVSSEQLPEIFASSCFCILPSRWENSSYTCLEAMSYGCIVVGSRYGGMAEIIEHNISGLLVNPYVEEIARAILANHTTPQRLQSMSEKARERARRWSDPVIVSRYLEEGYCVTFNERIWTSGSEERKVSVVIPLYNQGEYVSEAIHSVKASTYKNIEIVVVNDGSTDPDTNRIFDELEGVVKVSKTNGGLSSARNAGIAASSGHFIMPLDADDKIHPLYIEKAVNALVNNPELAYITCYAVNFGLFESVHVPVGFVPDLMLFMNTNGRPVNLFLRDAINSVRCYDESMISYEDWDLFLSLHENGLSGDVLPLEMHYYRRHADSMVYQVTNKKRSEIIQYMMRKHHKLFSTYAHSIAFHLVYLWKNRYELNESVQMGLRRDDHV